jgi:hypothetical protein
MPVAITSTKLLLGEGKDEVRFFNALLVHLGIADIQVTDYGGKTQLKDYLKALAKTPGFVGLASLAITRDSDSDVAAAFASVNGALANIGLSVPSHGRFT